MAVDRIRYDDPSRPTEPIESATDLQIVDAIWSTDGADYNACDFGYIILLGDLADGFDSNFARKRLHVAQVRSGCPQLPNPKQEAISRKSKEALLMIDFISDLWSFMRERKKFWLAPIILLMVLLGALLVVSQGSAVAPFIYTLF
jgi:hypothetical protein